MGGIWLGVLAALVTWSISLYLAHREYRRVYRDQLRFTDESVARVEAMDAGFKMLGFWWVILPNRGIRWVITYEPRPKVDKVAKLEAEIDRLAAEQDPLHKISKPGTRYDAP